jgi:hypothetical protein
MKASQKGHGGAGNQNAAKPLEARVDAQIVIRCHAREKSAWVRARLNEATKLDVHHDNERENDEDGGSHFVASL